MTPRFIRHMNCESIQQVFSFLRGLTYNFRIVHFQIVDGISVLGVPTEYDVFVLVEEVQPVDMGDPFTN